METQQINATIGKRILALVAAGKALPEAFDAVLGAGSYERLAGDVYATLRAVQS